MTKNENRTEMVNEAIARMKILKMRENTIRDLETKGIINYSDYHGFQFWFKKDAASRIPGEVFDELKSFEERTGYLVYHVIQSLTGIGTMWSLLYISKDADEWEFEKKELENGFLYAYVYNSTYPELSEAGSIMVRPQFGGVVRTA